MKPYGRGRRHALDAKSTLKALASDAQLELTDG
jgi:hypothetical protein